MRWISFSFLSEKMLSHFLRITPLNTILLEQSISGNEFPVREQFNQYTAFNCYLQNRQLSNCSLGTKSKELNTLAKVTF